MGVGTMWSEYTGYAGRFAFSVCSVLLFGFAVCGGAFAHTDLVETIPASGAEVEGSVEGIRLTFTEPVDPGLEPAELYDANGDRVRVGEATVAPDDPNTVVVPVGSLQAGGYGVIWRVTSMDGHVIEGDYSFSVASKPGPTRKPTEDAGETTQTAPDETSAPEKTSRETTIVADNASSGGDAGSGGSGNTGLYAAVIVFAVAIIALGVAGASRFRNRGT